MVTEPPDILAQFDASSLNVDSKEIFDLIIPDVETENTFQEDLIKLFDDDDEEEAEIPSENTAKGSGSLLAKLLTDSKKTDSISSKNDLPKLSRKIPDVQSQRFSKPVPILPKPSDIISSKLPISEPSPTVVVSSTEKKNAVLNVHMVVNLEFELTKVIQKQAGKCNNKNNKLVFYTAVLFQYGSILMPLSMREKLQHFMTFGSHNVHFIKKNPQRISYDTVEFLLMNISVEKPGKVHNVLMKMCKQEPIFIGVNTLQKIIHYYESVYQSQELFSRIQIVKGPINSNVQIADITTILNLDQVLKAKRLELVKEKFKNISTINPYIPKNSVKCLQCSKEFYFSSFFFYHQFLCTEESTSFNLGKIIEDRSKFSSTSKTCPICNSRFQNEIIWLLHLETHLTKGNIYACYLCSKIFLTRWSFTSHSCFQERKKPIYHRFKWLLTTSNVHDHYLRIDSSLKNQILICPSCGKKCQYLSQLLSHIHVGSPCLSTLILSGSLILADDLSIDLSTVCTLPAHANERWVQCQVCDTQCQGVISYMMHMDHHVMSTDLECSSCKRKFDTVCHFYSHSCTDSSERLCLFCQEISNFQDPPKLDEHKFKIDTEDLFMEIVNWEPPQSHQKEEKSEKPVIDLVFLNYISNRSYQNSEGKSIEIVDLME